MGDSESKVRLASTIAHLSLRWYSAKLHVRSAVVQFVNGVGVVEPSEAEEFKAWFDANQKCRKHVRIVDMEAAEKAALAHMAEKTGGAAKGAVTSNAMNEGSSNIRAAKALAALGKESK